MRAITVFQRELEELWQELYALDKLEKELPIVHHMSRIEAQLWILDREEALKRRVIGMDILPRESIEQGC